MNPGSANEPLVHANHLPYVSRLDSRLPETIDLVVMHCTELPDLVMAREYGERIHHRQSGTGNSGHFYIERSGRTEEWVPPARIAHHAVAYNERSIGIELDNAGRYPNWFDSRHQAMTAPYPPAQLESLARLITGLCKAFPGIEWISGHENLDLSEVCASDDPDLMIKRKMDPGPLFPWKAVLSQTSLRFLEAPK